MRIARFEKGDRGRPNPGGPYNICGVAVHALPGHARELSATLSAQPGIEVHAVTEDGRLVVTIEDTEETLAGTLLNDLSAVPGVASVALVYHQFEQPEALDAPLAGRAQEGGNSQ